MSAANRRVLVDFKQFAAQGTELGFPEGMTVDAGGRVWVACYDAHQVTVFEPERPDVVVERIRVPDRADNVAGVRRGALLGGGSYS